MAMRRDYRFSSRTRGRRLVYVINDGLRVLDAALYRSPGNTDWLLIDNADRITDWGNAGVWYNASDPTRPWLGVQATPDYPVGITMQSTTPGGAYYINPDGVTDQRSAIYAALTACPLGHAVLLPAGRFAVAPTLNIPTRRVLRGAGPGRTTLTTLGAGNVTTISMTGSGATTLLMDSSQGPDAGNTSGPIVSGHTKGSYSVTVAPELAANLSPGHLVWVNQYNDPSFCGSGGEYGGQFCGWAPGGGYRALCETKMVASVVGTTITFTRPLCYDYEAEFLPKLLRVATGPTINSGVEDLSIDGDHDGGYGGGTCIETSMTAYCWVRRVEFYDWSMRCARFSYGSLGNEMTKCYMHHAGTFAGNTGYGSNCVANSDCYVYDNVVEWVHIGICIGAGSGTANVIAYNYNPSMGPHGNNPVWSIPAFATHGCHTFMNLFEGNIGARLATDITWGRQSHSMLFRNWSTLIFNNDEIYRDMIAIDIERGNSSWSAIGNVLGHSGMVGAYEILGPENGVYDTSAPGAKRYFCWKVGFLSDADQTGPREPLTIDTFIRHGNYDYINNSVVDWVPGYGTAIPQSLYLSEKPSWWGSLDWPPIGPDVSGRHNDIPAKVRYDTYVVSGDLDDMFY